MATDTVLTDKADAGQTGMVAAAVVFLLYLLSLRMALQVFSQEETSVSGEMPGVIGLSYDEPLAMVTSAKGFSSSSCIAILVLFC